MQAKPTQTILKQCMNLKKSESLLVVTDMNTLKIGKAILEEGKRLCNDAQIAVIPVGKVSGEEPPKDTAKKMKEFDVIIAPTTKSLTHTKAVKSAAAKGARIATMPGITESVLERGMSADYSRIRRMSEKIASLIKNCSRIRIKTKNGTDITLFNDGKSRMFIDAGDITKKGAVANLPGGEIFFVPAYGKTEGIFVVDASIGDVGKVDSPVKISVKKGYAVKITGGDSAEHLNKILESSGKDAYNIAELGIGTNDNAKISGIVLEDEKVYGTAHIALGSSSGIGGKTYAKCHLDCVFLKPNIYIDGRLVMKEGRLLA